MRKVDFLTVFLIPAEGSGARAADWAGTQVVLRMPEQPPLLGRDLPNDLTVLVQHQGSPVTGKSGPLVRAAPRASIKTF